MFWASEITASDLKRGKNFVRVFATRTLPIIAAYCMYTTILTNALTMLLAKVIWSMAYNHKTLIINIHS